MLPQAAGTTAGIRMVSRGDVVISYGNSLNIRQAHNNEGPFAKAPAGKLKPLQTLWFYKVSVFMVAKRGSGIKSMDDLVGKKVGVGPPGGGITTLCELLFRSIGMWDKIKPVYLDIAAIPDALARDECDAAHSLTVADFTANPMTKQIDLRFRVNVLTFNKKQGQAINATPGITFSPTPAKAAFTKDVGRDSLDAFSVWYGWHWSPVAKPDMVYDTVKALFENRQKLVDVNRAFKKWAKDAPTIATDVISSVQGVPVHPGAARYYKEIGVLK